MPLEFRRALNIVAVLIKRCDTLVGTNNGHLEDRRFQDLKQYCYLLGESVKAFEKKHKDAVKTAGGNEAWTHARRASRKNNINRYKVYAFN